MEIKNLENLIVSDKKVFIAEFEDDLSKLEYKEGQQINFKGITNILGAAYDDKIELFEKDDLMKEFSTTHINLSNRHWCIITNTKEELNERLKKFKEAYIEDQKDSINSSQQHIDYSNEKIEKINKLSI